MALAVAALLGTAGLRALAEAVHGANLGWLAVAVLQAAAAVGYLRQGPAVRSGDGLAPLPALLSLGLGAVGVGGPPPASGPAPVIALLGALGAAGSILWLGPAFDVFPADRGLQQTGPFRLVRHPIYLGEGITWAALVGPRGAPGLGVTVVLAALLVWRVHEEERVLARGPGWAAYAARVRWRLVPGLW